jgi:MFS family permease
MTAIYPTLLRRELGFTIPEMSRHVMLFNVGMMAGAIVCGVVAARRGPIIAVVIPASIMILCLPIYTGMSGVSTYLGALIGGIFGAGFSGVTPLLLTSIFPAEVRARGVGIAYHLGAFGAAFVPPLVTSLNERGGLSLAWALLIVSAASLAAMVAVLLARPRDLFSEVQP